MSNTILEAMAAGLPVVATAVGGNPELVIAGETGLLIPHGEPTELANAIVRLARDPECRLEMGRRGRQRVAEHFSMEAMANNYSDLYIETFLRRFTPTGRLRAKLEGIRPRGAVLSRSSVP